jgi:hypothetical protein
VFILSFCSPSLVAYRACSGVFSFGVILYICVWVWKSLIDLFPRTMLTIGHLPPLCFSSCSWSSLNVLLCIDVRSLALNSYPPRRCVLVSGWLHLVHSVGPCELYFFLHLYTCDHVRLSVCTTKFTSSHHCTCHSNLLAILT